MDRPALAAVAVTDRHRLFLNSTAGVAGALHLPMVHAEAEQIPTLGRTSASDYKILI
jgi:hypothetical protein